MLAKPLLHILPAVLLGLFSASAFAEDPTQPSLSTSIGVLIGNGDHDQVVQSEVRLPLLHIEPFLLRYQYREITPFLKEHSQVQLLYSRYEFQADIKLADQLSLLAVAGYRRSALADRPGSLSAYTLGAGFASPPCAEPAWLEWRIVAGGFLSRQDLPANWWFDAGGVWRFWQMPERQVMGTTVHPSLGLAADIEAANEDGNVRGHYQLGPFLEFLTANGNRARFTTAWYFTDGNAFYEDRESALLAALEFNSSLDKKTVFDARDHRPAGWMPLVWGEYDLGWGSDRSVQRFAADAEIHDFKLAGQRFTAKLWYESRQEYRPGDFDNISYSVSIGPQTVIGLESILSQGQPLMLGCDYLHRSAHALDPEASRVPPGTFLARNSINLAPRLRLQTLGWDLPYRDPTMYDRQTRWLNFVDWRVTAGYDFKSSRDRDNPAAQLGLNWDIAAIQGFVIYARGIGSIGNETPDWLAEAGVRRPAGKLFVRAERYGLEPHLARGDALVAGVGFHL